MCELDLLFHLDRAFIIVDALISNGRIVETNKINLLRELKLIDRHSGKGSKKKG